nr:MAG TPA: hypothetical protein [Caudoviricetes sp.]
MGIIYSKVSLLNSYSILTIVCYKLLTLWSILNLNSNIIECFILKLLVIKNFINNICCKVN